MGMYFDTHTHYNDERYEGIHDKVFADIAGAGVSDVLIAGWDIPSSERACYDYVVDAIDSVRDKLDIIERCKRELKKRGIKSLKVVYSTEKTADSAIEDKRESDGRAPYWQ